MGADFRANSYSLAPVLLAWIPTIGPIISGIWSTVLAVLAIREGHATITGKADAVVLIPVAVMTLITLILALIIWALLFAVMRELGAKPPPMYTLHPTPETAIRLEARRERVM